MLPSGTQNPLPNALLIAPGKIDVSFVKPFGVTRTCAPPSTVWLPGKPPAGNGALAPHAEQLPKFPQAPIETTKSTDKIRLTRVEKASTGPSIRGRENPYT
jgi:hypothetical protein